MSFIAELRRRNVIRVALIYVAGSWLVMQVGDILFPALEVPDWSMRLLLALLVLGFPIAVLLAWTFELTTDGIRRDTGPDQVMPASAGGRRLDFAVIGLLSAAVAFMVVDNYVIDRQPRAASTDGVSAVAVLPLTLLNAGPEQAYLADGLTMSLINELSKIEALRVISRTSVEQYRDSRVSVPEIARALGVDAVIEGTVLSVGDRIRITANLVPASSDSPTWSEVYNDDLGDVLAMQTEIAKAVASQISISLTDADHKRLTPPAGADAEVIRLLYEGRHLLTETEGRRGLDLIEQATLLAPDYAPAWIELGLAYNHWTNYDPAYRERARAALQQALRLGDRNSDAHYLAGSIAFYLDWDWEQARRSLNRALELNPGNDKALQAFGDYYEMLGQYEKSIELGIRSVRSNPRSPGMLMNLGLTYEYSKQYDKALETCEAAIELAPNHRWAMTCVAESHLGLGNLRRAIEWADRATANYQNEDAALALNALVYGAAGALEKAAAIEAHFAAEAESRYVAPLFRAYAAYAVGDRERFFVLLDEAVEQKNTFTPWVATVPQFAAVRDDPRMQALIDRIGFPE